MVYIHEVSGSSPDASTIMKKLTAKVGVGVLIRKNKKILLIKRRGAHGEGTWAPPGGHIDFGESVLDCAKREVKEEVGVEIKGLRVLGFTQDLFKKDKKHYITIWVSCNWKSGKAKTSDREFSENSWFSWEKLPKPLFLPLKNFIAGKLLPQKAAVAQVVERESEKFEGTGARPVRGTKIAGVV